MQEYTYLSLDEFFSIIRTMPCQNYIVKVRYKYDWEPDWLVENQLLEYYPNSNPNVHIHHDYVWLNDWFEGQEWVEVMGFMPFDEVEVPLWTKNQH